MRRNPFHRLVSLKGHTSAVSKMTCASSYDAARRSKILQSQPMGRSTQAQLSDSEPKPDGTPPSSSDSEPTFETAPSTIFPSTYQLPSSSPCTGLNSPLKPNDPTLIRMLHSSCVFL